MNICIFTRTTLAHNMGGMEVHAELIARGLVKHGHQVTVLTTRHPGGLSDETRDGVRILYLNDSQPGRYSASWHRQTAKKLYELNETKKVDLVFSESGGAFYLLRKKIYRKLKLPVVVVMHGIFYNELKTRINLGLSIKNILVAGYYVLVYLFTDLVCIPRACAVIATSREQQKLMRRLYFLSPRKLFTVYNGIDTELQLPEENLKQKMGFQREDKIILSVARLKKEKGLQIMIAALPQVLKYVPKAKLLIIGRGEYEDKLRSLAKQLGVENEVVFAGQVPYPELGKYFYLADVFVNSTIRENGYDLTIIQAMAYGRPVVASNLRSLAGVVDPGENGFLVPLNNSRELAQTIVMVLDNYKLTQAMGQRAQKKARQEYSVDAMVNKTEEVFKQCL